MFGVFPRLSSLLPEYYRRYEQRLVHTGHLPSATLSGIFWRTVTPALQMRLSFAWDFIALARIDVNFSHQVLSLVSCTSYSELSKNKMKILGMFALPLSWVRKEWVRGIFPGPFSLNHSFSNLELVDQVLRSTVRVEKQERITPRWLKARLSCPLPLPGLQLGRFVSMWTRVFFQMYHRKLTHSDEW